MTLTDRTNAIQEILLTENVILKLPAAASLAIATMRVNETGRRTLTTDAAIPYATSNFYLHAYRTATSYRQPAAARATRQPLMPDIAALTLAAR
jgi:hypothetical protein